MLRANHSHPVSLAQFFHSCSCLQFLFYTSNSATSLFPHFLMPFSPPHHTQNAVWPFQKLFMVLHSLFLLLLLFLSQVQAQRATGNEAVNTRTKTEKAAQPKRKHKVEKRTSNLHNTSKATASPSQLSPVLDLSCMWNTRFLYMDPSFLKTYLLFSWLTISDSN